MTIIHTSPRHAVAAAFHAAAPEPGNHPGTSGPSAQAPAQFHQQRAGVLRPMPRQPKAAPTGGGRNGAAASARTQAPRDTALLAALDQLERGGADDLERWLDESGHDPLRQKSLLDELAERHPQARAAAATLVERLEQAHGPALRAGAASERHCASVLDELGRSAQERDMHGTALQHLRQRLQGGAVHGGASVADDAMRLLADLSVPGAGPLGACLARARQDAAREPGLRRANETGARLWMSLRQAASFELLASCLHHGAGLHAALSGARLLTPGTAPDQVGSALLGAARSPNNAELMKQLGVRAPGGQDGAAGRLVAAAVRQLPLALWPHADARRTLLAGLDDDAIGAAPVGTNESRRESRLESRLRATQENHHA